MHNYTKEEMSNKDEIKIVNTMLTKSEMLITKDKKQNDWKVQLQTTDFKMVLRYHMYECPLENLHYGATTWSLRVTNSKGNQVMYISSVHPQVAQQIGRLINKHEEKANKVDAEGDWQELEKWASL
jgi:hypothetical protein